ncbi:MAG: hypothetical protein E7333_07005 [Clostridiales bacterium]|nr:hypothetical protein [Clostridiales bacterium]
MKPICKTLSLITTIALLISPAAAQQETHQPRFTAGQFTAAFEGRDGSAEAFLSWADDWAGAFFRLDYTEKAEVYTALHAMEGALTDIDLGVYSARLGKVLEMQFCLPGEGDLSPEEAVSIATVYVEKEYAIDEPWLDGKTACVYLSFFPREGKGVWRVIFWPALGVQGVSPPFSGVVELDAATGDILLIRKNDPSSAATSIPYLDRL